MMIFYSPIATTTVIFNKLTTINNFMKNSCYISGEHKMKENSECCRWCGITKKELLTGWKKKVENKFNIDFVKMLDWNFTDMNDEQNTVKVLQEEIKDFIRREFSL